MSGQILIGESSGEGFEILLSENYVLFQKIIGMQLTNGMNASYTRRQEERRKAFFCYRPLPFSGSQIVLAAYQSTVDKVCCVATYQFQPITAFVSFSWRGKNQEKLSSEELLFIKRGEEMETKAGKQPAHLHCSSRSSTHNVRLCLQAEYFFFALRCEGVAPV